jgi:hypothetical protein
MLISRPYPGSAGLNKIAGFVAGFNQYIMVIFKKSNKTYKQKLGF